jgi:hypothetical protein
MIDEGSPPRWHARIRLVVQPDARAQLVVASIMNPCELEKRSTAILVLLASILKDLDVNMNASDQHLLDL